MVDQATYRAQSRQFMGQAFHEPEIGDLRQASEKGWGAAAQMVKAVADYRGWRHGAHRMLNETISTLAAEADEAEIGTLFAVATTLHTNFYEGGLSHAIIEDSLHQTSRFIDRLEALLPA